MADVYRATVSFPGITRVKSCVATANLGITPSLIRILFNPPVGTIQAAGSVVLTWLKNEVPIDTITFIDCFADAGTMERDDSGGLVMSAAILDRRWKWAFPTISGNYNLRHADGKLVHGNPITSGTAQTGGVTTIRLDPAEPFLDDELNGYNIKIIFGTGLGQRRLITNYVESNTTATVSKPWDTNPDGTSTYQIDMDTERTPRELAELCLDAMGETGYSVAALPTTGRPLVEWDHVNAAAALADICSQFGCDIEPGLETGIVTIVSRASGAAIATAGAIQISETTDPAERPDTIRALSHPIRIQADIPLIPVGQNRDNSIVPIDDLDYTPVAGDWEHDDDIIEFRFITDAKDRELAKMSVFKWFRPRYPITLWGPSELSDGITPYIINDPQEIQIEPVMVLTANRGSRGNEAWPAIIYGSFFDNDQYVWGAKFNTSDLTLALALGPTVTQAPTIYTRGYSFDAESQIFKFTQPMVFYIGDIGPPPALDWVTPLTAAELYARCSFFVRDKSTRAFIRTARGRDLTPPTFNTGAADFVYDDVTLTTTVQYDVTKTADGQVPPDVTVLTNRTSTVNPALDGYLDAIEASYGTRQSHSALFYDLRSLTLDGAINSVTWSVDDGGGARTFVQRNQDFGSPGSIGKAERRSREREKLENRALRESVRRHRESDRERPEQVWL